MSACTRKGKVSARVAYNWRSKYLVTAVDCCVYLPVWQKGAGFLDGSIRYRLTDAIEFSVEGSNLLNTKTVLYQQVTDVHSPEGKIILTPNGWFQNDRRFIVGVRWKMASSGAAAAATAGGAAAASAGGRPGDADVRGRIGDRWRRTPARCHRHRLRHRLPARARQLAEIIGALGVRGHSTTKGCRFDEAAPPIFNPGHGVIVRGLLR